MSKPILKEMDGAVAYITYRVLRYGERNYGGEAALLGGEPPPKEPPRPSPGPQARPPRRPRRR